MEFVIINIWRDHFNYKILDTVNAYKSVHAIWCHAVQREEIFGETRNTY